MDVSEIISVIGIVGAGIWQLMRIYAKIIEHDLRIRHLEKDKESNHDSS